jgi:hypothetical protein
MPKAWHAIPLTSDPRLLAKAPNFTTFLDQQHATEHGMFFLPRQPHAEAPIAAALMDAVPDIRDVKLGEQYVLYRYPQGLAVKGPSGWTFMIPYDMKKGEPVANPKSAAPKGVIRPRGKAAKTA